MRRDPSQGFVAKTPASLSISPCVHPCSFCCLSTGQTLILSRGSGPRCPKEGAFCACLAGTNQEWPYCHTAPCVCCELVRRRCWEGGRWRHVGRLHNVHENERLKGRNPTWMKELVMRAHARPSTHLPSLLHLSSS